MSDLDPHEKTADDHWHRGKFYQWRRGELYVNGTRVRPPSLWERVKKFFSLFPYGNIG